MLPTEADPGMSITAGSTKVAQRASPLTQGLYFRQTSRSKNPHALVLNRGQYQGGLPCHSIIIPEENFFAASRQDQPQRPSSLCRKAAAPRPESRRPQSQNPIRPFHLRLTLILFLSRDEVRPSII